MVRRVCVGVFWATLAYFVYLWVADHALQLMMAKREGPFAYPGKLCGLVATQLMIVQVVLMARIPVVERAFGRDRLVRVHRLTGFTSLNLMLAHIVLLSLDYMVRDHITVLASLWWMVTQWRGMVLATLGTVLLIMVGVTSARGVRRRLRYHTWHLLHLYTLLGITLVVPHVIWAGSEFKTPGPKWIVVGLYVFAVASLVIFRVALPVVRSLRHRVVVDRVAEETPGNVSVYLRGQGLARLRAQAGQFFIWRFRDGQGWTRGNPYALSTAPGDDHLRITAKEVGPNSRRLRDLRPGTRVLFEGPYGGFTEAARHGPKLALMASGIGITPIRALLEDLDYEPGEAILLYRASAADDFVFRDELEDVSRRRGVRVVYLPGHRAPGPSPWHPADLAGDGAAALEHLVHDIAERDVFICGPDAWAHHAAQATRRAGASAKRIHVERFAF